MISSSLIFSRFLMVSLFFLSAGSAFGEEKGTDPNSAHTPPAKEEVKAGVISFQNRKQTKFRFRNFNLNWRLKHPFKVVEAAVEGMGVMRINPTNLSEGIRVWARIAMKSFKFPPGIPVIPAFREVGVSNYRKKSLIYFASVMEVVGQNGERVVFRTLGTNKFDHREAVQQVNFECLPAPKVLKCTMDGKLSLSSLGLRAPRLLGVEGDDFITFWGDADLTPEI